VRVQGVHETHSRTGCEFSVESVPPARLTHIKPMFRVASDRPPRAVTFQPHTSEANSGRHAMCRAVKPLMAQVLRIYALGDAIHAPSDLREGRRTGRRCYRTAKRCMSAKKRRLTAPPEHASSEGSRVKRLVNRSCRV
jgi:hypothetical protein